MKRSRPATAITISLISLIGLGMLGACTTDGPAPTVPRLGGSAAPNEGGSAAANEGGGDPANPNAVGGDSSAARRARLHAAAQCIREHGSPQYQDPLLTSDGYVYTDEVALRGLEEPQMDAIDAACGELIHAANFSMRDQGPPPPQLIRAGVKSAECLRAHGLPNVKDPTADSRFSPGKGFGLNGSEVPAGGKRDPGVRRALEACRTILDEEAAVSSLGNLGHA